MTYSQVELEKIKESIQVALRKELNIKERYCFLKNLKIINNELEILRENLEDSIEEYKEYKEKAFKVMLDCGAEAEQLPNGGSKIKDFSKMDEKKFDKKIDKLNEEYEGIIKKQTEINQRNLERMNDKVAKVAWFTINIDDVSSSSDSVLNENTLHLIE